MRIDRREFGGALATPLLAAPFLQAQPSRRPNIVLLLPDQVPAHVLGVNGERNVLDRSGARPQHQSLGTARPIHALSRSLMYQSIVD